MHSGLISRGLHNQEKSETIDHFLGSVGLPGQVKYKPVV